MAINYNDVLVVYNTNSEDSVELANYFINKRDIIHSIGLDVEEADDITPALFQSNVREPIEAYLTDNDIITDINYIVLIKGMPIRVSWTHTTIARSMDSILTIILSEYSDEINTKSAYTPNPAYRKDGIVTKAEDDIYMVTRLDGYTIDDAKALVTDNILNKFEGTVLLDADPSKTAAGGGHATWNNYLSLANDMLIEKGYDTNYSNTETFQMNLSDLSGYTSWGSNDSYDTETSNNWNLQFNEGSIGETYVSTSARSFQIGTTYGQSLIADLISMGITGVKGYTNEPTSVALANPNLLFDYYTDGYNLAETYYQTSYCIHWMDIIIGDPKLIINENIHKFNTANLFSGEIKQSIDLKSYKSLNDIKNYVSFPNIKNYIAKPRNKLKEPTLTDNNYILLEDGYVLLTEGDFNIILEETVVIEDYALTEDGYVLLLEDGYVLLLEGL